MWEYKGPKSHFFTDEEKQQVVAIFEAILPGGENNPGATDAGAADYLDKLLAMEDSEYYEFADWRPLYRAGLAMLNGQAQVTSKKSLYQLKTDEMRLLLTDLKAGNLRGFPNPAFQKNFFNILRQHCIEGSFSDPRWGGNRSGLMWAWYGYPSGPSKDFTRTPKGT